jgi:hypothetical protein
MPSPLNPLFPSLGDIQRHLSDQLFVWFNGNRNQFFKSQDNVNKTLKHLWQSFPDIPDLVLQHPSPGREHEVLYLCRCCERISPSCEYYALRSALSGDLHDCCPLCYDTKKHRSARDLLAMVPRMNPSSRAPISTLSATSLQERYRIQTKELRSECKKNIQAKDAARSQ